MTISWVRWCSEPRSQSHEHGQNFSTKNTPSAKMLLALCLEILYQPLEPLRCANIWKPPTSLHYACRTSTSIHESMQDINYACPTLKSVSESQATLLTRSACTSSVFTRFRRTLTTFPEPLSAVMSNWETFSDLQIPFCGIIWAKETCLAIQRR